MVERNISRCLRMRLNFIELGDSPQIYLFFWVFIKKSHTHRKKMHILFFLNQKDTTHKIFFLVHYLIDLIATNQLQLKWIFEHFPYSLLVIFQHFKRCIGEMNCFCVKHLYNTHCSRVQRVAYRSHRNPPSLFAKPFLIPRWLRAQPSGTVKCGFRDSKKN